MFDDAQPANRQFIDFQRAKACLLDHQTTDREAPDRQRTDGDRTESCRAQRERQHARRFLRPFLPTPEIARNRADS